MEQQKENEYYKQLKKFINKEVEVTLQDDTKRQGTLIAIQYNYLHTIIKTKTEAYLIKHFKQIKRTRQ